jgi:hypothetical protein
MACDCLHLLSSLPAPVLETPALLLQQLHSSALVKTARSASLDIPFRLKTHELQTRLQKQHQKRTEELQNSTWRAGAFT